MGYIFGDLVIESIIREGMEDLISNIDVRLPEIYAQLKDSFLNAEYGQQELDRYKDFLLNNQIDIVQSWRQVEPRVPCIWVQNINNNEDVSKAMFDNYSGDRDVIGMGGQIIDRKEEQTIPISETIQIGIFTKDPAGPVCLRWMYVSVLYFLMSRRHVLLERGIDLATFQTNDLVRQEEYLPENIFSRFISFNFVNWFTFKKLDPSNIIENIVISRPNGGIKVETGIDNQEPSDKTFYTLGSDE